MTVAQRIKVTLGDITQLDVEAVVTAANSGLMGGGGVDGAVHAAAGPELVNASMALAPCPPGQSRLTLAFKMKQRFVIHTVGPIFSELESDSELLASAYRSALELSKGNDIESIAFPCISTGVYGFPSEAACDVAINTVVEWLKENELPDLTVFCCFSDSDYELYQSRMGELGIS